MFTIPEILFGTSSQFIGNTEKEHFYSTYEYDEVHGKQAIPGTRATTIRISTHSHFCLKKKNKKKTN